MVYNKPMNRDRHSKHRNNWKNNRNGERNERTEENKSYSGRQSSHRQQRSSYAITAEQIKAEEEAIKAFKIQNQCVCQDCGQPINELTTAIADTSTGNYIHFDCAIARLQKTEKLSEGDKIIYIGQGRFGILNFPNVHDMRCFTIKKIIEWEPKEKTIPWRKDMAELYSHIK